jgi:serine protease AprX
MSPPRTRTALLIALVATLMMSVAATAQSPAAAATQKVSPMVLTQTAHGGTASFLVELRAKADLSGAALLTTKTEKGRYVYDTLRAFADRTQAPIKALLGRMGATYRSHFMANVMVVTGNRTVVDALAARSDVARIDPNRMLRSTSLPVSAPVLAPQAAGPTAVEWNVQRVRAPQVWALGDKGQGIVIGDIDTGEQWDHPALKNHYRGWNGSSANHNYNWYDEIDPSNRAPIDQNGHGTHTAGTIVGDDGGSNQVGVAPRAKWMACRSMDATGFGSEDTYVGCYEFMLAPWNLNAQNPDPSKAPVAVSDSWFCSVTQEGCVQSSLLQVVQAARAAGIVPVFAAGNEGPGCSTVGILGPPAQYDESFTVGASTISNTLAFFSSRGPAHFQGQTLVKPDIMAPGDGVRSSYPPNTYAVLSGTSMATPHIAGVIALIYKAKPSLIGNVDATEALIESTAFHINSSECSSNGTYPNNLWGYGFVNALAAVTAP